MYLVKFEEYRAFTAWYRSVQHVLVAAPRAKIFVRTVAYWSGSGGVRRPTVKKLLYPLLSFMQEAHGSKRLYIQSVNISAVKRWYTMQKKIR